MTGGEGRVVREEGRRDGEDVERRGRGSQVWQAKDLRKGISGSVARKGLTGQILGSVASKGVSIEERSFDSLRSLRTRILAGCSFLKGYDFRRVKQWGSVNDLIR